MRHLSRYTVTGVPYQTPQPPPLSPALDLARSRARYATDPELVSLPRSKGQGRAFTLLVLALGVVAAVGMVVALARDAGYALRGGGPFPLGELGSVGPASLAEHENRAVEGFKLVVPEDMKYLRFSRRRIAQQPNVIGSDSPNLPPQTPGSSCFRPQIDKSYPRRAMERWTIDLAHAQDLNIHA